MINLVEPDKIYCDDCIHNKVCSMMSEYSKIFKNLRDINKTCSNIFTTNIICSEYRKDKIAHIKGKLQDMENNDNFPYYADR